MGQQIQSDGEPVFQASVFRNDAKLGKPNRVLKAHATAAAILDALAAPANGSYSGKMTSAEFALEMIKAADEVTYTTAT